MGRTGGQSFGHGVGLDPLGQLQSGWAAAQCSERSAKAGPPWRLEGGEGGLSPFVSRAAERMLNQPTGWLLELAYANKADRGVQAAPLTCRKSPLAV